MAKNIIPLKTCLNVLEQDKPKIVQDDLAFLVESLDNVEKGGIPPKALDKNLVVGTWNIKKLGNLFPGWHSNPDEKEKDSVLRDLHAMACIAEIVSRFDVLAIQEVMNNPCALKVLMWLLGPAWGVILSDESKGRKGNYERMAYVFDTRKVSLNGLACELVIPTEQVENKTLKTLLSELTEDENQKEILDGWLKDPTEDVPIDSKKQWGLIRALLIEENPEILKRQFDRTPYVVGFKTLDVPFTMVSLHIRYGDQSESDYYQQRIDEIRELANWVAAWRESENAWDNHFLVVGDFNIKKYGDEAFRAFTDTGLMIPEKLISARRTLGKENKFFDQVAWFKDTNKEKGLPFAYLDSGSFDFTQYVFHNRPDAHKKIEDYISDHLPLWVEFSVENR